MKRTPYRSQLLLLLSTVLLVGLAGCADLQTASADQKPLDHKAAATQIDDPRVS